MCVYIYVHVCMYICVCCESCLVVSNSLWSHRLYSPWNAPGQNAGVSSLSLLQGIFPTHGSNLGLLHCRRILYQLSHKGNPHMCMCVYITYLLLPKCVTHQGCLIAILAFAVNVRWASALSFASLEGLGCWVSSIRAPWRLAALTCASPLLICQTPMCLLSRKF